MRDRGDVPIQLLQCLQLFQFFNILETLTEHLLFSPFKQLLLLPKSRQGRTGTRGLSLLDFHQCTSTGRLLFPHFNRHLSFFLQLLEPFHLSVNPGKVGKRNLARNTVAGTGLSTIAALRVR